MLNPKLHLDSKTKVNDFDRQIAVNIVIGDFIKEDNILGFDVSVNDVKRMNVGKSSENLFHDFGDNFLLIFRELVKRVSNATSFTILHHNIVAVLVLYYFVDSDYGRMANFFE